jgi:hypothetical protein
MARFPEMMTSSRADHGQFGSCLNFRLVDYTLGTQKKQPISGYIRQAVASRTTSRKWYSRDRLMFDEQRCF